jgi:MFS family permease
MAGGAAERLRESLAALREVFRNPGLRRLELAWAGSITGEWAYAIALAVYAYDAGGTTAVGLVSVIRFIPSAAVAPFAAMLADRYPRQRVMLVADLIRALAMGVVALASFSGGPAAVVYVLAAIVAVVSTAFQPAQAALLPSLARRPEELTAANVASSTIESVGSFVGPALGGLLLALTNTGLVFAVTAGAFLWSALNVARIRAEAPRRQGEKNAERRLRHEALGGFKAILGARDLRVLVGLYAAQTLVAGALNVLVVVAALELLDLGRSGPGLLNSAVGVGGLVGAAATLALVGRHRLAGDFAVGLVLWGAPLVLLGLWPSTAGALVLLAVLGIGNTIVDVAGLTLLQRSAPPETLARVFGVLESLVVGTIGLGAILAPVLVGLLGVRTALVATGVLLPTLAVVFWRRLSDIDARGRAPEEQLGLLRAIPLFTPLPVAATEHLAGSLVPVRVVAGEDVVRQGEPGDRFYIVADGRLDVLVDGRPSASLEAGDYFGEIALLREVPRTATVRAQSNARLYALERDEFVGAVTGHPGSAEAADAVVAARLGSLRPGMASI